MSKTSNSISGFSKISYNKHDLALLLRKSDEDENVEECIELISRLESFDTAN